MPDTDISDLIEHLSKLTALSDAQSQQVVVEVLAYFNEDIESYVRRRHHELQQQGLSNVKIFTSIRDELPDRLFPAEEISERKIRRMIYG